MQEGNVLNSGDWVPFVARFSQMHSGQEADIELVNGDAVRPIAIRLPLIRITPYSLQDEVTRVEICAGDSTGMIRQDVCRPAKVQVQEWDDGGEMELQAGDGTAIRVRVTPSQRGNPSA